MPDCTPFCDILGHLSTVEDQLEKYLNSLKGEVYKMVHSLFYCSFGLSSMPKTMFHLLDMCQHFAIATIENSYIATIWILTGRQVVKFATVYFTAVLNCSLCQQQYSTYWSSISIATEFHSNKYNFYIINFSLELKLFDRVAYNVSEGI